MLKAVIVDASAISRSLLNTVLTEGGYSVAGQSHSSAHGYALAFSVSGLTFQHELINSYLLPEKRPLAPVSRMCAFSVSVLGVRSRCQV